LLIEVEQYEPFHDLPSLDFDGKEETIFASQDILVLHKKVGHYAIYRVEYIVLPQHHPNKFTFHIFDIAILEKKRKKEFKIYNAKMKEITLGQGTYDIGLNFSGGRIYSDSHFRKTYYENQLI